MEALGDTGGSNQWVSENGTYVYHSHIPMNPLSQFPVSAVCFDPTEELLWCGNMNGRVVSYYAENNFAKYTAFVASNDDIRALEVTENVVFSLSSNTLKANSKHGLSLFNHTSHNLVNLCSIYRLLSAPTLLLGGDQKTMIQFDVEKQREIRVAHLQEKNVTAIRSSGNNIFTSDSDGNLTMRSVSSLESIKMIPKAHGGPITDFDICGNSLITCGCSFRVNALHGDPYVKVYDLRNLNPLAPVALSFAPIFARFLPTYYDSRVFFCSQTGQAQVADLNERGNGHPMIIQSNGFALTSLAISSNMQFIALGDEIGNVHLYTDRSSPVINDDSFTTDFADPVLAPPVSFQIDDLTTPLSAVPLPFCHDETLLSDWPEELCQPVFRRQKPLSGAPIVKTLQYVSYAVNPMSGTPLSRFNFVPYFLDENQPTVEEVLEDRPVVVPHFYRKMKNIRFLTPKGNKSDAAVNAVLNCNKSQTVPLEDTSILASAVNPIAHLFFAIPALTNVFLSHICDVQHCIACQLGFLFRMMNDRDPKTACSSANLIRSMIASGIPPLCNDLVISTQQAFNFIVHSIHKELIEAEGNDIAELLETELHVNSRCIRCSEVGSGNEKKFLLTLQYSNVAEHLTLCSLIEKALHLRGQREGDCTSCTLKTRLEETRRVKKMPPILLVDANPSCERYRSFWEGQLRLSERRPRYKVPEHEYTLGGVGKAEKSCRYGADCRNRPYCKYSHGCGDWEAECETWLSDTGGEWRHFVNKSFSAKVSNGIAILSEQSTDSEVDTYELIGIVVQVCQKIEDKFESHVVTLMKTSKDTRLPWVVVNDVLITQVHEDEALHMDPRWKLPLAFVYASKKSGVTKCLPKRTPIPSNVFLTDCNLTGNDEFVRERSGYTIPGKGEIVGIDAEFVNIIDDKEGVKSVGRLSCVDSTGETVLIDDYVVTCDYHVVGDYLTSVSGIMEDDLNPSTSTKHLTTLKRVYLKLLHLVEKGVIFVGHALQNDFSVLNIYVPKEQTRDTVSLFYLPRQRLLSLQFLAFHLLGEKIQCGTHDSVEDARIAVRLYKKYLELEENGTLASTIAHLYETGTSNNWRTGDSPPKSASPISSSTE